MGLTKKLVEQREAFVTAYLTVRPKATSKEVQEALAATPFGQAGGKMAWSTISFLRSNLMKMPDEAKLQAVAADILEIERKLNTITSHLFGASF